MLDDERSPLWGLAAWGSLAAGIGAAALKHSSDFSAAWARSSMSTPTELASSLSSMTKFARQTTKSAFSTGISDEVTSALGLLDSNISTPELKSLGYRAIMAGGKTTHQEAISALSQMEGSSLLENYSSLSRIVSSSRGDIGLLEKGITSGGLSAQGEVLSKGLSLNPAAQRYTGLLSPEEHETFSFIKGRLEQAGAKDYSLSVKTVPEIFEGTSFENKVGILGMGGKEFVLPLNPKVPITYGGGDLTARYITRGGYLASGKELSYTELATNVITDAITNRQQRFNEKEALHHAHRQLLEQLKNRDSADRAAAINTIPEPFLTSGGRVKSRLIANELVPYGGVTEEAAKNLIAQNKFHPYVSPGAAGKNILTKFDIATALYGPQGQLFPAERRPGQVIRGEWGVSEATKKAFPLSRFQNKMAGAGYTETILGGKDVLAKEAYTSPQLLTFFAKHNPKGSGWQAKGLNDLLALEQGFIRSNVAKDISWERTVSKEIALEEGFKVNPDILSAVSKEETFGRAIPLSSSSSFLGTEYGTGQSLSMAENQKLAGIQLIGPNKANVFLTETFGLNKPTAMAKVFSGESKSIIGSATEEGFDLLTKKANLPGSAANAAEAFMTSKLIERNPAALITQQIEAASYFLRERLSAPGNNMTPEAVSEITDFLSDPARKLNVSSLLAQHDSEATYHIQKNLVDFTRRHGFNKTDMQLTFGLMDRSTLKRLYTEGSLGIREAAYISRSPGVMGMFKGMIGDIVGEGAGYRGSLEPTTFRLMATQGQEGLGLANMYAGRLEDKGFLSAMERMEASVFNDEELISRIKGIGETLPEFSSANFDNTTGQWYSLGKKVSALSGASKIYVPGTEELGGLIGSSIQGGERISSPLTSSLMGLQRSLSEGNTEAIESSAASLKEVISRTTAEQATARGKIFGSKGFHPFVKPSNTRDFAISQTDAIKMLEDLTSKTTSKPELDFLAEQTNKLMKGESVWMSLWRHPTTGPFSHQVVKVRVDFDLTEGILAAPTKFGKIQFQDGRIKHLDISPMVGLKADFDKDILNLGVISDKSLYGQLEASAGTRAAAYEGYLAKHYAMQELLGKRSSSASIAEMREIGYSNLGLAKRETGKINLAIQEFKMGLALSGPKQYNRSAELLFNLEEQIISGKHGTAGSTALADLVSKASSTTNREQAVQSLETAFSTILGGPQKTSVTFGENNYQFDFDPRKYAEDIIDSYSPRKAEIQTAMQASRLGSGKDIFADEDMLQKIMYARRQGSADISQALMEEGYGAVDNFSKKVGSRLSKVQARGSALWSAVKKAKKPLLLGAAAAAGIMFMAPGTSGRISASPVGKNNGIDPDSFGPPGGQPMNPPRVGQNSSPSVYDHGGRVQQATHANIRVRTNDLNMSGRQLYKDVGRLSAGANTHVKVRDDRAALDPHTLANKIQERL